MVKYVKIALFLVVTLIFIFAGMSGCAGDRDGRIDDETVPAGIKPVEIRYIIVDEASGDVIKDGAAAFAHKLNNDETDFGFDFRVLESRNPLLDFERGDACYVFLSGRKHAGWTSYSGSFSRAFLYTGYEHFTMSLNAGTVLEILEKELEAKNMKPLAAFYQGSDFLLSSVNLDDYESFKGETMDGVDAAEQRNPLVIGLRDVSAARVEAYRKAGAMTLVDADSTSRLECFLRGEIQAAEFSFEEDGGVFGSGMSWEDLFFVRSWQNADPLWLIMDKGYEQGMAPWEKAWVKEAVAELFPRIDGIYLERENAMLSLIVDNRAILSRDFSLTRQQLDQNSLSRERDDPAERKLLAYIRALGAF